MVLLWGEVWFVVVFVRVWKWGYLEWFEFWVGGVGCVVYWNEIFDFGRGSRFFVVFVEEVSVDVVEDKFFFVVFDGGFGNGFEVVY